MNNPMKHKTQSFVFNNNCQVTFNMADSLIQYNMYNKLYLERVALITQ